MGVGDGALNLVPRDSRRRLSDLVDGESGRVRNVFAVGPWFAYLFSEYLPVRATQLRTAAANLMLLILFIATLKLAEYVLSGPVAGMPFSRR